MYVNCEILLQWMQCSVEGLRCWSAFNLCKMESTFLKPSVVMCAFSVLAADTFRASLLKQYGEAGLMDSVVDNACESHKRVCMTSCLLRPHQVRRYMYVKAEMMTTRISRS